LVFAASRPPLEALLPLVPLGSLKSAEFVKIRSIRWAARLLSIL
jgi:hypothetical protein